MKEGEEGSDVSDKACLFACLLLPSSFLLLIIPTSSQEAPTIFPQPIPEAVLQPNDARSP